MPTPPGQRETPQDLPRNRAKEAAETGMSWSEAVGCTGASCGTCVRHQHARLLVTWTAEDASCYLSEPQLREIVIALLLFLLKNIVVIVVGWLLLLVCVCA